MIYVTPCTLNGPLMHRPLLFIGFVPTETEQYYRVDNVNHFLYNFKKEFLIPTVATVACLNVGLFSVLF